MPTDFKFKAGRDRRFHGEELSYVNARCPNSRLLRARIEAQFGEETILHGSCLDPCRIRER